MKKIKIAQIGTSKYSHGNEVFSTLKSLSEAFEVVGYCFPEREREKFPENMKAFEGRTELTLEEILSDKSIEAVTVETEEIYLTKYALLCIEAGKHIHMEKPGSESLPDFESLISAVKTKNTVFHTGYMYRYNPEIRRTIDRIKSGEFGEIISVEAQMSGFRDEKMTRWLDNFMGGMMFYLGCHLIDLVLTISGVPEKIHSFNKSSGLYQTSAKDNCFALFEYKNGVSFIRTSQAEHGGYSRRQLVVIGTKGTVELKPLEIDVSYPVLRTDYRECFDNAFAVLPQKSRAKNTTDTIK